MVCHPFASAIINPCGELNSILPPRSTVRAAPMFTAEMGKSGLWNSGFPAGQTKMPRFRARTQRFPAASFWMIWISRPGSPLSCPKTRVPLASMRQSCCPQPYQRTSPSTITPKTPGAEVPSGWGKLRIANPSWPGCNESSTSPAFVPRKVWPFLSDWIAAAQGMVLKGPGIFSKRLPERW